MSMCKERGKKCPCGHDTHQETEILRIARRNRWTLTYLAFVTTALLVLMIMEANGRFG